MSPRLIPVLLLLSFMAGCSSRTKPEEVCGSYSGSYAGVEEQIDLLPDGRLHQVATRKNEVVYDSWGTWKVDGSNLEFHDFYIAVDLSNGQLVSRADQLRLAPEKFTVVQVVDYGGRPRVLTSAPDTPYFFRMQDKKPNKRAGVDAGLAALFAFGCAWPGTTQRERYAPLQAADIRGSST